MQFKPFISFFALLISFIVIAKSFALPAPKYLSVSHWKSCTHTYTRDTAKFICLPPEKPTACPYRSWKKLTQQRLIVNCSLK